MTTFHPLPLSLGQVRVPVILVGNKSDLERHRQVSLAESRSLAESWGAPFMETSAKTNQNVDDMFVEIVREMNARTQKEKGESSCCLIL